MLKECFFQLLLLQNIGVEFQIVAFQKVVADLHGGDTIHHALNIDVLFLK